MPPNVRSFVADDASVLELAVPAMRFSGSNGPAAGIQQVESAGFFLSAGLSCFSLYPLATVTVRGNNLKYDYTQIKTHPKI